ncbi:hypothetical protein [Flagellimonas sediminis]|uniref:Uncharacterized protein n=1 Tax=Flagellimonas sediminis TaxID=2696468 RepID=A0A6I5KQG8_9FLAO|nr:hypothetical protein [Allomuricauda sediminis]NDV42683.1 hypothetical protein [Allomuricauda sediminis]
MKKITIALIAIFAIGFTSCEVEPVDNSIDGVAGKAKVEKTKPETEETPDCTVSLLPTLPSMVSACTTSKGEGSLLGAYFDLTINDTELAGNYAAWCVDVDLSLGADECYDYNVYSSYAELPAGAFEQPGNFDLINWIVNQNFVGQASPSGGAYTFGDVQWAIWELIDDKNCVTCAYLGSDWSRTKGQEIVDAAIANGEGYEPGAGEVMAVVLIPTGRTQSVIVTIPLGCEPEPSCETAFARGTDGNTCFIGEGFSRWGWSIGPLAEGTQATYDVYAGAGQCDISKGELVGTVDVSYIDGNVTVTYNIDAAYNVSDTHTYAGSAMFPTKNGEPTVAPGQYYIEENLSGDIYVIAHADVCKD